jgi:hypothetical protein
MSAFMVEDETINTPRQDAEETGMSEDIGKYECGSICILVAAAVVGAKFEVES